MSVIYKLPSQILAHTDVKQCFLKPVDGDEMCAAYLVCSTLGHNPKFKEPIICGPCAKSWKDVLKFEELKSFLIHYNDLHRLSFKEISEVVRGIGY
jgi:hypothetical protein